MSPRSSKFLNWSYDAQAGDSSTVSPAPAPARAPASPPRPACRTRAPAPRPRTRAASVVRVLADGEHALHLAPRRLHHGRVRRALALAAGDEPHVAREGPAAPPAPSPRWWPWSRSPTPRRRARARSPAGAAGPGSCRARACTASRADAAEPGQQRRRHRVLQRCARRAARGCVSVKRLAARSRSRKPPGRASASPASSGAAGAGRPARREAVDGHLRGAPPARITRRVVRVHHREVARRAGSGRCAPWPRRRPRGSA